MNLLSQFIIFLNNQKKKPSFLTVKNYKADIGQFTSWFEKEFKITFDPSKVTLQTLEQYKKARNLSPASLERHMSSLRKFFSFLSIEKIINQDPLARRTLSAEASAKADPWMIRNFKSFLYENKKSNLTIKNYINDIKSFFKWLEEVSLTKNAWKVTDKNLLSKINSQIVEEYKQRLISSSFSPLTINRKLSSLRSYISWARTQGVIKNQLSVLSLQLSENSLPVVSESVTEKPKTGEQEAENRQQKTDNMFNYSPFPPLRLVQKSLKGMNLFFDYRIIVPLAKTIDNTQYLFWKSTGKRIFTKRVILKKTDDITNIKKEFYAPLDISLQYLPIHKRIHHFIRHKRPKWYRKYHSYSFTHYLHFAILIVVCSALGFGIYSGIFADIQKTTPLFAQIPAHSPRTFSFQGKLTDISDNPIAKPAEVVFSLYNSEANNSTLWQETNSVQPDANGSFSTLLGKNNPIPGNIFSENSRLFLGVKVGESPELIPRQELATSPFAENTATLQGLEPITNSSQTSNVVLALDSSGNLTIADSKPHTFQTLQGNLVLSGNLLTLTSALGSNSNVEIAPDGTGIIDLKKPLQNTSNSNTLGVEGALEIEDIVAILASNSAQAALNINQTSTGALIAASSSGVTKFTVENDGRGIFAGDLEVNGADITSTAKIFNLFDTSVTTLNIGGEAKTINLGVTDGTLNVRSNVKLSKDLSLSTFTSNGGLLYTNDAGKVLQATAGSTTDCFTGGTTPAFKPCKDLLSTLETASISGNLTVLGETQLKISTQYSQRLCHSGSDGSSTQNIILGDCDSGGADIAEYYGSKDATIEAGDIVVAASGALNVGKNSKAYVNKSTNSYQGNIIGIVSTNPYDSFGKNFGLNEHSFPVALAGRVPLKISLENGPIKAGDLLTSSSIPGVGAKAVKAGTIIGKALEDINSIGDSNTVGFYDPDNNEYRNKDNLPNIPKKPNIISIAKIHAFVNISWHDPDVYLTSAGNLSIEESDSPTTELPNGYIVKDSLGNVISRIGAFAQLAAANIRTGLVETQGIVTQTLIVSSDNLIVNGQNLKDYITTAINGSSEIISPIIITDRLATNIISPLSPESEITIKGKVVILSETKSDTLLEVQGDASISGELQTNKLAANELTAQNASVSGTLRADKLIANSVDFSSSFADLSSYSAQLAYIEGLEAEQVQINQGLMVFGSTSLYDLSVINNLSIGGNMFLAGNSIEVLGAELSLQSLRQGGLSIMGGLVYVDTEGNLAIEEDVTVKGNLAVNTISPLPDSDLVINNSSGSGVLSINQKGDLVASGSATFSKLNLSLVQPALALSPGELIASSSAGVANIAPFYSEVTIKNRLVTDESVIYITPVGTPSAQTPFLMRQVPDGTWLGQQPFGEFTVGVQTPTSKPIPFNWLIVN